jgi:hypothetical protein
MKDEEPLYVGVVDPVGLRKDLLNSVRDIIHALKEYEMFTEVREERELLISDLKGVVREINILNARLKQLMPKTRVKGVAKPAEIAPVHMPSQEPEMMRIAKPRIIEEKTRLAELEDELAEVESKLQRME